MERKGTPRDRRKAQTRELILQTARDLVLEGGPAALSVRELARRIDYTPGALYRYFPTKEALVEALNEGTLELLGDYFAAAQEVKDPVERLQALGVAYLRFARENPAHYLTVFTRLPASGPADGTRFETPEIAPASWRIAIETCREGHVSGRFAVRPGYGGREIFYHFFALHHGLAMLRLTRFRSTPEEVLSHLESAATEGFFRSISAEPKERS
jgi:AcrR family transcriptional regulator